MEAVRYEYALTDNEILTYSQILDKFKKGIITYFELSETLANYGITIEPVVRDISKQKMTVSKANTMNDRLAKKEYIYSDIDYYILNSKEFNNVAFRIDRKAIEILANAGIPEYQTSLMSLLVTELKYLNVTDAKSLAQRNKHKRRIDELKLQLAKTEEIDTPSPKNL